MRFNAGFMLACSVVVLASCTTVNQADRPDYDLLITGGNIYDGSGDEPYVGDVAIKGDRIVYVGRQAPGQAQSIVQANGKAVSPGFINMLSHSQASFDIDPRLVSDIKQGVTLEVLGEGWSMGPLTPATRALLDAQRDAGSPPIDWTTLDEYLRRIEERGVSANIASFVGATTVRLAVLGEADVDPTPDQLVQMRQLVAHAMRDGAMGLGTSLIYPPAGYSETPELIALASEAGKCGGMYISHMRSEGDRIEEAVDELIEIARSSGAAAEIHHLKLAGKSNWSKLPAILEKVESARAGGLQISANMYPYDAGATGLTASLPLWVQAGGMAAMLERLKNPEVREQVIREMRSPGVGWENLLQLSGGTGENITLIGFQNDKLAHLIGLSLADAARARNSSVEDTIIDLIMEDNSRVEAAYRVMSEQNVRRKIQIPWMSFGSDAPGQATEGIFLESSAHPRAYGTFARVLGRYVRDEGLIPLKEAVRRMTSLPAENLKLRDRGRLSAGYYADLVIFDPQTIKDNATYEAPHQYSSGVDAVWVNGKAVLLDGEPTGVAAGRVVRGPGWTGWPDGGACKP